LIMNVHLFKDAGANLIQFCKVQSKI